MHGKSHLCENVVQYFRSLSEEPAQVRGSFAMTVTISFVAVRGYYPHAHLPNLENHFLSAVHDYLNNIFAGNLHSWRPFPSPATRRRATLG
jgi:hypothetical protein